MKNTAKAVATITWTAAKTSAAALAHASIRTLAIIAVLAATLVVTSVYAALAIENTGPIGERGAVEYALVVALRTLLYVSPFVFLFLFAHRLMRSSRSADAVVLTAFDPGTAFTGLATRKGQEDSYPQKYRKWVAAIGPEGASAAELEALAAQQWGAWEAEFTEDEKITLARVARHEAAHALAAHVTGSVPLEIVVRNPDSYAVGTTNTFRGSNRCFEDQRWSDLIATLAGRVYDVAHGNHDLGSTSDMEAAHREIMSLLSTGRNPSAYTGALTFEAIYAAALDEAGRIITVHDTALTALAGHIEGCGWNSVVSGATIRRILEENGARA